MCGPTARPHAQVRPSPRRRGSGSGGQSPPCSLAFLTPVRSSRQHLSGNTTNETRTASTRRLRKRRAPRPLSDWRVPGRHAPRPRVRATAWLRGPFAGAPPGQGQRAAEQEKFTQQAPDWTLGRVCLQGRPRRVSGNLGFGRAPPAPDP
uniref:Uncharacterized protein n=1 Tax=Rousettus aegyptiacus TaxID=9407 RepID=A0A7J8IM96_ROUAE|nr:hypothetical protein HJG63_010833 [Rousettus aegyptiacus]